MIVEKKGLFFGKKYFQEQGQVCVNIDKAPNIEMLLKARLYFLSYATFFILPTTKLSFVAQATKEWCLKELYQLYLT